MALAPTSLLELPKELLMQVFDSFAPSELCQPARANGILHNLCERLIYRNVSVIKYNHMGKTNHDAIRCFFRAIKKQPRRLSYIKEVDARLELREDSGLHHACQLFEALPEMPQLTDLTLEVVGGTRNRSLEQSFVWGCTFERGRTAFYKFFRLSTNAEQAGTRGFHALKSLRTLKVIFPVRLSALQTDLVAYSALQHESITNLELRNIINASLAPPKLPRASGTITHLTMRGCSLPAKAYQSIFESIVALEHLDYRPARPMGMLSPGGLVKALAHHTESLCSLSVKTEADEMLGLNLSEFTKLIHLEVHNPAWDEDRRGVIREAVVASCVLPAVFPPYLHTLTLKNYYAFGFEALFLWLATALATRKATDLAHLQEIRLGAEYPGDESSLIFHPIFVQSASGCVVKDRYVALGAKLYRQLGIRLVVEDTLYFEAQSMTLHLKWYCRPRFKGSEDMVIQVDAIMDPEGAFEVLCLLRENTPGEQNL